MNVFSLGCLLSSFKIDGFDCSVLGNLLDKDVPEFSDLPKAAAENVGMTLATEHQSEKTKRKDQRRRRKKRRSIDGRLI